MNLNREQSRKLRRERRIKEKKDKRMNSNKPSLTKLNGEMFRGQQDNTKPVLSNDDQLMQIRGQLTQITGAIENQKQQYATQFLNVALGCCQNIFAGAGMNYKNLDVNEVLTFALEFAEIARVRGKKYVEDTKVFSTVDPILAEQLTRLTTQETLLMNNMKGNDTLDQFFDEGKN